MPNIKIESPVEENRDRIETGPIEMNKTADTALPTGADPAADRSAALQELKRRTANKEAARAARKEAARRTRKAFDPKALEDTLTGNPAFSKLHLLDLS